MAEQSLKDILLSANYRVGKALHTYINKVKGETSLTEADFENVQTFADIITDNSCIDQLANSPSFGEVFKKSYYAPDLAKNNDYAITKLLANSLDLDPANYTTLKDLVETSKLKDILDNENLSRPIISNGIYDIVDSLYDTPNWAPLLLHYIWKYKFSSYGGELNYSYLNKDLTWAEIFSDSSIKNELTGNVYANYPLFLDPNAENNLFSDYSLSGSIIDGSNFYLGGSATKFDNSYGGQGISTTETAGTSTYFLRIAKRYWDGSYFDEGVNWPDVSYVEIDLEWAAPSGYSGTNTLYMSDDTTVGGSAKEQIVKELTSSGADGRETIQIPIDWFLDETIDYIVFLTDNADEFTWKFHYIKLVK